MAAARRALAAGKPVIILKAGNTTQGLKAAASHTANLTSSYDVFRAAFRQCGIIEVQDTGNGMDEAFIKERLFRPFDSTKGKAGMGIGVYEARDYIHRMGGDLEVISRVGEGSTFRVRLPIREAG